MGSIPGPGSMRLCDDDRMTIANGPNGRTGVVLRDPLPWPELKQIAETAEETEYETVFVPEIAGREAFSTLAGLSAVTSRIMFGTGVATIWSRTPPITAMAAATVQDLSNGRMILGVGSGTPQSPRAGEQARAVGAVALVREYVRLVRAALAGEPLTSEGPFEMAGFQLGLELTAGPPPIWLAALGDRMLALAGDVADGVIMNWCTPDRVRQARLIIDRAARRAGRGPGAVTLSVYVRACLGVEQAAARAALAEMTAQYASIPHYLRQMERMGLGTEGAHAARALSEGKPEQVPESLIRALTVIGDRDDALARFAEYREAGADLVLCYPVAAREPYSSVLGTVLTAAPSPAALR
jgi:5,10-methylenetetrahydromethanopterin reductase